ncbi:hypothetical protein ACROYT_G015830 [Oculina patagonica]
MASNNEEAEGTNEQDDSEQDDEEPSLLEIKTLLINIQTSITNNAKENQALRKEVSDLKASLEFSDTEMKKVKDSLDKAISANTALQKKLDKAHNEIRKSAEKLIDQKTKNVIAIFFKLETYSEPKDETIWRNEWGGKILFSHGTNHKKGVCILLNPSTNIVSIESQFSNDEGRIVLANLSFNSVRVSQCNIYASNNLDSQLNFISSLNQFLSSNANISELIVGGDWNVALEAIDKTGGIPWRPTAYREQELSLSREFNLVDILRVKNPSGKFYTYESKALKMKSRIDYFLIAKLMSPKVFVADIKISVAPDHRAVRLGVKMANNKRGPGLWKFNNSLLKDQEFKMQIQNNYPVIKAKYAKIEDMRLKWELIKMELRGVTIAFSKNKARTMRAYIENVEKQLAELDIEILNYSGPQSELEPNQLEQDRLKKELQYFYGKRGEGAIFRSKLRWVEQGEKPTKYFFNLEARNFMQKTIVELRVSDSQTVVNDSEILKRIEEFYENLYSSEYAGSQGLFDNFTENIDLPQLS